MPLLLFDDTFLPFFDADDDGTSFVGEPSPSLRFRRVSLTIGVFFFFCFTAVLVAKGDDAVGGERIATTVLLPYESSSDEESTSVGTLAAIIEVNSISDFATLILSSANLTFIPPLPIQLALINPSACAFLAL